MSLTAYASETNKLILMYLTLKALFFPKPIGFIFVTNYTTTPRKDKGRRWRQFVGSETDEDWVRVRVNNTRPTESQKSTLSFKRKILKFGFNLSNIEQETAI